MAPEQRLRDELNRATESVRTDTAAALERVVATARRRQRVRHAMLAVAAAVLVVVGAVGVSHLDQVHLGRSPGPANHSSGPGPLAPGDLHADARTVLTGEWQSAPVSAQRVRSALSAAGISRAVTNRTIGEANRWLVQLTFSQANTTSTLVVQTSDHSRPGTSLRTSEGYVYRLLPDHRLLVTSTHPGTRWVFSYRKVNDTLSLHVLLSAVSSPPDERSSALLIAWTVTAFTLVH